MPKDKRKLTDAERQALVDRRLAAKRRPSSADAALLLETLRNTPVSAESPGGAGNCGSCVQLTQKIGVLNKRLDHASDKERLLMETVRILLENER